MDRVLLLVAGFGYGIAFGIHLMETLIDRTRPARLARRVAAASLVLHALGLLLLGVRLRHFPIATPAEAASLLALLLVVSYQLVQVTRPVKILGLFLLPVASLMGVLGGLFQSASAGMEPILRSPWLPVHVSLAVLSYAALTLATCLSIMYLIQERQLKSRRPSRLSGLLPPIGVLDRLMAAALYAGFALLTLALSTGLIWSYVARGALWSWDPKEILTLVTWLLYATLLHARVSYGWRGRRASYLVVGSFVVLLIGFFGIGLFTSSSWHVF